MYYRTIPADLDVGAISGLIADEEAGGSKFVENKVAALKTAANGAAVPTNIIKFLELDDVPAEPTVLLKNADAPTGKAAQWTGVMLVKGTMKVVVLYR
jgi:hypothetical protein